MTKLQKEFEGRFSFDAKRVGLVRVVREYTPRTYDYESLVPTGGPLNYIQEAVTGPCKIEELQKQLTSQEKKLENPFFGELSPQYDTIAPEYKGPFVPLTRIEIYVNQWDAIPAYRNAVNYFDTLAAWSKNIERLTHDRAELSCAKPEPCQGWDGYYMSAQRGRFVDDPNKSRHLIRITSQGSIDFRLFPGSRSIEEVVGWAHTCHVLCRGRSS